MINPKIFNAVLMAATKETKDLILKALIEHIGNNYDYNDAKAGHIVEMLVDKNSTVTLDKVNLKWIEDHPERLMYKIDEYNIKNIVVDSIDNIDCTVRFSFQYCKKINEDRDDINYDIGHCDISFVDYPEILK